jgi:hypothetical protein
MMKSSISRRRFLSTAAMTLAAARLRAQQPAQPPARVQAALQIPAEANGPEMPADFIGLSYEVQQLADPSFFSPRNTRLVRAFKELSSHGVLRLGGNTSEFAW